MRANEYAELAAFVAISEERSFRRAAARLNLTPSTLSHSLRALEERLGVRLLNRTTRTVSPTDAGQALFEKVAPAFTNIDAAIEGINAYRLQPHGVIRLNVPRMAATLVLAPAFRRFARTFPDVTLEVAINDGFVDIVGEGFDAGIRLGQSVDQDMTVVRVTPDFKIAILGSPDYFASHPAPKSPQDLHNHLCIGRREIASGALYRWEFEQDGKPMVVQVSGPLVLDTPDLMISAALDGVGLIYSALGAPTAEHIATGRLVRVLEEWSPTIPGFFIYFPGSRQISAALRALLSMLRVES